MRHPRALLGASLAVSAVASSVLLTAPTVAAPGGDRHRDSAPQVLNHVGSFFLTDNQAPAEAALPTSAEIIAFTRDRKTLVYTDAFGSRLGFADTSDPSAPQGLGTLDLPGDPTSVAIIGRYALVSLVTSDDFDAPAGELLVIDLATRATVRTIPLAGQPDAIAVAPSGKYAAVVIENERDEDENGGLIPQAPAGLLQVLRIDGPVASWSLADVDLTGLADVAPEDPEPEYVDINRKDRAVVSLQENNHLAIVDLRTASVVRDFSAGTVDLADVDTTENEIGPQGSGLIELDGSLTERRREPDSVQWIDDDTFVTANEGDYEDADGVEGGTRSFTLFRADGRVEYEAGNSFEHRVVQAGHYPESRSENKGAEPEGLEVGSWKGRTYLFVGAERANVVGVYEIVKGRPVFRQLLPTGIGPEGLVFDRGVLAVSSEVDGLDEGFAARPFLTFFAAEKGRVPAYPMIASGTEAGLPLPWVAQSGLSGDPRRGNVLWSVSDSVLGQAFLYKIDASKHPARIVKRIPVGGTDVADQALGDFDLEGVAARPEGGFWLASEGRTNAGSSRPNLLVRTDSEGTVLESVPLPDALVAGATSSGFEGVAVTGSAKKGTETVYAVIQREWADDAPGFVKVGKYLPATGEWTFAAYPLDARESPAGGWVGLSEVTALPNGHLLILERDNQLGQEARIKRLYSVDPSSVEFAPIGQALPLLGKSLARDILDDLDEASISVPDKVEGVGLTRSGRLYVVTDNDGVDENYGETVFLRVPRR